MIIVEPGYQPEVITLNFMSYDKDGSVIRGVHRALQIDEDHVIFSCSDGIFLYKVYKSEYGPEIGDRAQLLADFKVTPYVRIDLDTLANMTFPELMLEIVEIRRVTRRKAITFI
ncbi:hypothetical protein [Metabacillus sp. Hm71]|uniref:hypothetical protein n=1 Tax=Metabacillus sp. Hm71 TaxID=3450743 RepID=UPI003F423277